MGTMFKKMAHISDARGKKLALQLISILGLKPHEWLCRKDISIGEKPETRMTDREIRYARQFSNNRVIFGPKGYKLTEYAAPDEIRHCINSLRHRASELMLEADSLESAARPKGLIVGAEKLSYDDPSGKLIGVPGIPVPSIPGHPLCDRSADVKVCKWVKVPMAEGRWNTSCGYSDVTGDVLEEAPCGFCKRPVVIAAEFTAADNYGRPDSDGAL
jgi:hypothetical protein